MTGRVALALGCDYERRHDGARLIARFPQTRCMGEKDPIPKCNGHRWVGGVRSPRDDEKDWR
jgi:hypothetical protein